MVKSLKPRRSLLLAGPIVGCAWFAPLSGDAQDGGGVLLRFGVEQRLETNDNLGLDVVSDGVTTQSTTRLSFGVLTETRVASLRIDGSGALRVANGPDFAGTEVSFADPQISLAYSLTSASSKLDVNARLRATDVEFLRSLDEFIDEDGEIVLPDDVTGTGTQLNYGVDTKLSWGEEAPLGFSVSAGLSGITYIDTASPTLLDSQRYFVGASARLTLSDVTEANTSLRYSTFDEEGVGNPRRDTLSFSAGLRHQRPNGNVTSRFTATNTEDGTRLGLSFGRSLDLPDGSLRAEGGVTRAASGEVNLTGALNYSKELPLGQFTAQLRRSVSSGSDDSEILATALTLGYRQELTAISAINLDLSYSHRDPTGAGATVTDGTFSATYQRALTEDWNMNVGYRHRMRDESGVGRAHSNTVFVGLNREFNIRR